MRFNCTSCGQRYKADESFAGEEIECSKCDSIIYIPELEPSVEAIPEIKINLPDKKTSIESQVMGKVEVPKLTIPASLGKKMQANKTEKSSSLSVPTTPGGGLQNNDVKAPSLGAVASTGEKLGANKIKSPSLGTTASTSEKLGDNSIKGPSLGAVASSGERLGDSNIKGPSLSIAASPLEKLRG